MSRRTRLELQLASTLRIGDAWRRRDGEIWTVYQIYRKTCQVLLQSPAGSLDCITFDRLATTCQAIADHPQEALFHG